MLACPSCERRYFLPRAGRSLDDERLQLEPVPLLAATGRRQGGAGGMSDALDRRVAARRAGRDGREPAAARSAARPGDGARRAAVAGEELCDLCGKGIPPTTATSSISTERRILCVCESCLRAPPRRPRAAPDGTRDRLARRLQLSDELWARFAIPIGLAFFLRSSAAGGVVALYPSPAGATESELELDAWKELVTANPVLMTLEPDAEALIVNRMSDPPSTRSRRSTSATGWSG